MRSALKVLGTIVLTLVGPMSSPALHAAIPASAPASTVVVPVDWHRFHQPVHPDTDYRDCARILQTNSRYNLAWLERTYPKDAARQMYIVPGVGEQGIRAACSVAYGMAVLLKTGTYDAQAAGIPKQEAITRTIALIKGASAGYAVGEPKGHGWGDQWQSALWTGLLGQAGWMLWDHMKPEERGLLQRAVTSEADRFIAPGYKVPYWANPDGHINTPGDTKAEENAWNSMVLQVAVAMMPHHPHVQAWKHVCSELMVSAFALQKDALSNTTVLDGTPVKDWLHGFNVRDDGAVINHGILHPDYMATPTLSLRSLMVQSLAGQPVPQTAEFNAALVYKVMVTHIWEAPPYKAPGGTIYLPGKAEVYYPMGTDWSPYRFDIYYLYDTFAHVRGWDKAVATGSDAAVTAYDTSAHVRGWDKGFPHSAQEWMRVRAKRMLDMQARFTDGGMYAPNEHRAYPNDQMVAWQMGDALLLQWLNAQNAIDKTGNWLVQATTK